MGAFALRAMAPGFQTAVGGARATLARTAVHKKKPRRVFAGAEFHVSYGWMGGGTRGFGGSHPAGVH
jgi:hypothetical protein